MSSEKRRYPRVFLNRSVEDFKELMGVQVRWPNDDVGGVLDLSYIGAALSRPAGLLIPLSEHEIIPLDFYFHEQPIQIQVQFVREISHAIGVCFPELSAEAHLEIEKFLKEKMIGLNTHYIQPQFYSRNQSFAHWYHGPNNTNIFIWENSDKIEKATIEIGHDLVFLKNDRLTVTQSKDWVESLDEDYAYYLNGYSEREASTSKTSTYEKIISVLSQIPTQREPLDQLLNILKNIKL